jgi:hypothetical protein
VLSGYDILRRAAGSSFGTAFSIKPVNGCKRLLKKFLQSTRNSSAIFRFT